jgi:hypothetical protein
MANLIEYQVAREHQGDRLTDTGSEVHLFKEGETRLADPSVVGVLVKLGVLVDPAAGAVSQDLRTDGPTVAEYVAAGYLAANYPPQGYASRSSEDEIAAAIAAQKAESEPAKTKSEGNSTETKVDPPAANKAAAPAKSRAASKATRSKAAPAVTTKAE